MPDVAAAIRAALNGNVDAGFGLIDILARTAQEIGQEIPMPKKYADGAKLLIGFTITDWLFIDAALKFAHSGPGLPVLEIIETIKTELAKIGKHSTAF